MVPAFSKALQKGWPAMAMKFDPTINLGHILTAAAMLAAGFAAYSSLAQRVAVLEQLGEMRAQKTKDDVAEIKADLREIRGELKELRTAVQQAIPKPDRK